jgi:NADPH:quinone reductase
MVMKALRFEKYGAPSNLTVAEIDRPRLQAGEALVEVKASAVNPIDVKNVAGAFRASLPRVPGRDFAGVVVEGGGAEWDGKEVWGSGAGFGVARDGTHAEYLAIPIDWLAEKPNGLSMEEAAAIGVPYLVAWGALIDAADLQKGETILITGASGAVGRAATQIAHRVGAKVIGADRTHNSSDADIQINTTTKDLVAEVKRLTGDKGVDLVLDAVGGPMFEVALNSVRRGGRQVAITSVGSPRVELNLVDFYHELKRLIGVDSMKFTGQDIARNLDKLRTGFELGQLKPSPVQTWPIAKAVEAYQVVEHGGLPAKQILLPHS